VLRGRSPGVTLLYNEQYLTAGNLIAADVGRALNGASSGPPVRVDARLLFNPAINYARGVGLVLITGLVQIVAGLSTIYVVGRELKDSTAGEWLAAAQGSVPIAWIGKLGPYVLYDLLLTLVLVGGFVAWFHMPVRGSLGMLGLGALAFSLASKAIGVLLTVLPANLRQGLGVGSILFGPAVAFSGVTFPRIAMSTFAQVWGGLVPLTRFMLVIRDQVMVGAPLRVSVAPILALTGIALGAGLLSWPRMGRILRDPNLWGRE
jgi:ABC-2 type transport system permease protein